MGLLVVTPPASYPVTLDEAKAYLRVDADDDDDLISGLIGYACDYVERETGQQMMTATRRLYLDCFPSVSYSPADYLLRVYSTSPADANTIFLPTPPLASVTSVKYLLGGAEITWNGGNYTVDAVGKPGRIVLNNNIQWPTPDNTANAVRIDFVCGYGTADDVPNLFKQAIKWLVGHCYENREATTDLSIKELPFALRAVIESLMFRQAFAA